MALSEDELRRMAGQLYADLNDAIAKHAWGGAALYVRLYNHYLAQAKSLAGGLDLDEARGPMVLLD